MPGHDSSQPRDFKALRLFRASRSLSPPGQFRTTPLSTKLPDPSVFTGNKHVLFDDWKMRIQDKLVHNRDHYPTESFKIAYVITRLGGDTSGYVSIRRRFTSYNSIDGLLDHLTDLYEVPLNIVRSMHRRTYYTIAQGD